MSSSNGGGVWKWISGVLSAVLVTGALAWFSLGGSELPKIRQSLDQIQAQGADRELRLRVVERGYTDTAAELRGIRRELERIRQAVEK